MGKMEFDCTYHEPEDGRGFEIGGLVGRGGRVRDGSLVKCEAENVKVGKPGGH